MPQCMLRCDRHVVEFFLGTRFKQENEFLIPISIAGLKVFADTWDGSWDIPISRYQCQWPQLGQVRVDLEDPAALATFLVTANIKLIRAEWLGDALERLNSRKLTMSISEGSIWLSINLNFGRLQGNTSKQSSIKRWCFFWILCVARMTTPTMDPSPSLEYIWNLYANLSCRFKSKSLTKGY